MQKISKDLHIAFLYLYRKGFVFLDNNISI